MLIEDRFEVKAPRETVWSVLRNPEQMMPCVPGCKSIESLSDKEYRAEIVVSVGPVKARFEMTVEIVEELAPQRLKTRVRGDEGTRASQLKADNEMRLSEVGVDRTEVYYASELSLTGRLGRFGLGMMRKTSSRLMKQFQDEFTRLVENS